jgi:hypothetical protein
MNSKLIRTALDLYEHTKDLMLLDAVRVLSTAGSPEPIRQTAEDYVTSTHTAFLNLYQNSGIDGGYGNFNT